MLPAAARGRPRRDPDLTAVLLLYAFTLFVSATLLFVMQPMVGKMILPLLGGTPAVWSTCMVFFRRPSSAAMPMPMRARPGSASAARCSSISLCSRFP